MKEILLYFWSSVVLLSAVEGAIFISSSSTPYYSQSQTHESNKAHRIHITRCKNITSPSECIFHNEFPMDEDDLPANLITSISLENRNVSTMPIFMNNTRLKKHLRCLNLAQNNIPLEYFALFGEMNHLRKLLLDHQGPNDGSRSFPQTAMSYPNLQILDVSGNNIEYLTDDFQYVFPSLHFLNLSENPIYTETLNHLPKSLYWLYLKDTGLTRIDLRSYKLLKNLILDNNFYERLDAVDHQTSSLSIEGIRVLKYLSLVNCSIRFISNNYFKNAVQLNTLDLSYNRLKELTGNAIDIPTLRVLNLNHNSLIEFPSTNRLKQLISLSLNHNELGTFPKSLNNLVSLKSLSLRGNRLRAITDDSFVNLRSLQRLDLSENQLHRMPNRWTLTLNNLIDLNLNSNKFQMINDVSIVSLPSLKRIVLRNNSLSGDYLSISDVVPHNTKVFVE